MSTFAPFSAAPYELPAGSLTAPLPDDSALSLADAFAALPPWACYAYPASALGAYLSKREPGAPRFLLRAANETAGAVGLRLSWLRGPYIQFLGILPAFQRQGIGASILAWAEREARSGGERNLWIAASEINAGAIRFYERHGYSAAARLDGLVCDGRTEILYRKRL